MSAHILSMLVAMLADRLFGWPAWLFARIGHPVTWIGALISLLDRTINRESDTPARRRALGVIAALLVIGAALVPALGLMLLLPDGPLGIVLAGVLAWPLIALRSLDEHVQAVWQPLANGDLAGARHAVSMIVGRDPAQLDEAGIARAAIESLAENTSDGVTAPLFWGLLLGLPGIAAYKALNTLDSMIGHRTPRHEAFGWASARLDDVANLVPARLTGLWFAMCAPRPRAALRCMWRDAPRHRSPNAGWPEAAMAGGLGVRISGPRLYAGRVADEPWVNDGAPDPDAASLQAGLALYRRAMLGLGFGLLVLAVVLRLA